MEFIKKHYEKVILLGLLVIFIIIMIMVVLIASSTKELSGKALKIPKLEANYKAHDRSSLDFEDKFNDSKCFSTSVPKWEQSTERSEKMKAHYSDLLMPFDITRCAKCNELIPRAYLVNDELGHKCPICGEELKKPTNDGRMKRMLITAEDSDGDGISDADEAKYGLDPANFDDAIYDADGDGFSNIYELKNGTNPRNPKSHPALWKRLRFVGLMQVDWPLRLKEINTKNEDPNKWQVTFERFNESGKWSNTMSYRFNQQLFPFDLPGEVARWTLKPVVAADGANSKTKVAVEKVLEKGQTFNPATDRIELEIGQVVKSPEPRPVFEDFGEWDARTNNYKQFVWVVGKTQKMGSYKTGSQTYKLAPDGIRSDGSAVLQINVKGKWVTVDAAGEEMVVTREGVIPAFERMIPANVQNQNKTTNK